MMYSTQPYLKEDEQKYRTFYDYFLNNIKCIECVKYVIYNLIDKPINIFYKELIDNCQIYKFIKESKDICNVKLSSSKLTQIFTIHNDYYNYMRIKEFNVSSNINKKIVRKYFYLMKTIYKINKYYYELKREIFEMLLKIIFIKCFSCNLGINCICEKSNLKYNKLNNNYWCIMCDLNVKCKCKCKTPHLEYIKCNKKYWCNYCRNWRCFCGK